MEEIAIDIGNYDFGPTQPRNEKKIDRIIVSQYVENESYAVTYSQEDNSVRGWNIEGNGQQQPDVYFELLKIIHNDKGMDICIDEPTEPYSPYYIYELVLHEKFLLFRYYKLDTKFNTYKVGQSLIDLSSGGQYLNLRRPEDGFSFEPHSMGFLPNGDLVLISLDGKIYLYSFKNKPTTNATLWEYSQVYDTEVESLNELGVQFYIYQTKLFIFDGLLLIQWDLLSMSFEIQYDLVDDSYISNLVTNENQTLLALDINGEIYIFSMETETCISKYDPSYLNVPVEFVILKDGSEGLIIYHEDINYPEWGYEIEYESSYRFLDPYLPSDASDITNDITDNITDNKSIVITKSNKKFCIKENKVCVTGGLKEDVFQNMLNTTYHSNVYTLPIFKAIRNMLIDIEDNLANKMPDNELADGKQKYDRKLENGQLFQFNIKLSGNDISLRGVTKSLKKDEWKETLNNEFHSHMLSYQQLNNQDFVLITLYGIYIYTIVDNFLRLRYFWSYEKYDKWNQKDNIIQIIRKILVDEFKDSQSSLPPPNFITIFEEYNHENKYKELVSGIIRDPVEFSKFGSKMLKIAIDKRNDFVIDKIFHEIFDKINDESMDKSTEKKSPNNLNRIKLLSIISLNLPKLHSNLVTKYILHTSIILDPTCSSVKNSTNPSINAYSKDVHISSSNVCFKSLTFYEKCKNLIYCLKSKERGWMKANRRRKIQAIQEIQEVIPTIRFIAPFPKICEYQENHNFWSKLLYKSEHNSWNEMLYKPESILFCNVDATRVHKWWNFAAIIDFKWEKFGKYYYYWIWFLYTIFFICFASASTLDQNSIPNFYREILFIISISLGFVHLSFEFRHFLYNPGNYILKDPWNLLDLLAYFFPIITSIWFISGNPPLPIVAISNLLLNFKFLLFFRVFNAYERYFIIITRVIYIVLPFIGFLFVMIIGFAHAFLILLRPTSNFSLDTPTFNNDENNPWNLAIKYNSINSNGTISSTPTLIQTPDSNTNMFDWFGTSLLAVYLLLIGDSGSFSWTYRENIVIAILLVAFTFFVVIYLMNLFIGLLNVEIEKCHEKCEIFLLTKARVIAEIEICYMSFYQRSDKELFPNRIYYDIPVEKVRTFIKAVDNDEAGLSAPPFISKKLRELVKIPEPVDEKMLIDELKKQIKDELQQQKQQMQDMQELIVNLIKDLSANNNVK